MKTNNNRLIFYLCFSLFLLPPFTPHINFAKRFIQLLLFLILYAGFGGQMGAAQHWDWVDNIRMEPPWGGNNYGWSVATDQWGNVVATGRVKGFVHFGYPPYDTITSAINSAPYGSQSDVFIVKYDNAGKVKWARQEGGFAPDWGRAITTDLSGNVLVTGDFCDSAWFGNFKLYALGTSGASIPPYDLNRNIFIAKYDSMGNCLWAKSAGGAEPVARGYGICTDEDGNIYVTGYITGVSYFGSITSGSAGISQCFMAKYSADGTCLWVKTFYSLYGSAGNCIRYKNGKIYLTGIFRNSIIFPASGGQTAIGINPGWDDIFLAAYDTSAGFLWASAAIGDYSQISHTLTVDSRENIYIAGHYYYQLDFGDTMLYNPNIYPSPNGFLFLARYNSGGDFQWARSFGDSGVVGTWNIGMDCDKYDNIFVSTHFGDTLKLDSDTIGTSTGTTSFVMQLDSSGKYQWVKTTRTLNGGWCFSNSMALDKDGNIFCGGEYTDSISFDSTVLWDGGGGKYAFVAKLFPPLNGIVMTTADSLCTGDSLLFTSTSPGSPLTYSWTFSGGSIAGATAKSAWVRFDTPGIFNYSLIVSNPYETDTISGSITIFPNTLPQVVLGPDTAACYGYLLDAGSGFMQYLWSDGSANQQLFPDSSGQYFVVVIDSNYCKGSDTINLIIHPVPDIYLGPDTFLCGNTIMLDAGNGYSSYMWSTGETTQSIIAMKKDTYVITVTTADLCSTSDTLFLDTCTIILDPVAAGQNPVRVIPNPVSTSALFYLADQASSPSSPIRIVIMNELQQNIYELRVNDPAKPVIFHRGKLPPGFYFYRVISRDTVAATGKLIIE
ncbi:MAG: SBBP repeat-containing protein [Bacteroidetes bacterium]|nr:SBBP repeat-containing protein [Bacteroidota bacterium]